MAAPARTLLSELPKGHHFATTTSHLTADALSAYLQAVGDGDDVYVARGLAPPLAVAARALGALLDVMELPAGTLHTGQEVAAHAGIPIGATLTLVGRIAQRSERAGMVIAVIEFEVSVAGSDATAVTGRTTVLFARGAS